MISFLLDTLLATGALIALVLVLRKPVGRLFGPGCAYTLWLLPLLRFAMPPILLPASLAPQVAEPVSAAATVAAASAPAAGAQAHVLAVVVVKPVAMSASAPVAEPYALATLPWGAIIVSTWLGVALGFLAWRFVTYRKMRRDLLAYARPVGEAGKVRLVETPAVSGPVAFGIIDKVVALPIGFMAIEDRAARDFAIAHELAHHRGRDLAANIVAQPLLALHWFNPLAWLAWRAMRRDQEAACDARVIAAQGRTERARYAQVIASFAAGPRLALAAPMACPMLGEKSIIHRLRSLRMDDVSRRRRLLGRSLVVAGGLALPLTATVTYAASELPDAPEAPEAPAAPELPDVLPEAPLPPDEADGPHKEVRTIVIQRTDKHGKPMVQHFSFNGVPAIPPIPAIPAVPAIPSFQFHWNGSEDPDFQKKMEAWGKRMEKWGKDYGERYSKQAEAFAAQAERDAPEVIESCDGNPQTVTRHETTSDGRQRIVICQRVATRQALSGLRSARETIAGNEQMDPEVRDEVVQELDEEIQRIEGGDG